MGHGETTLVRDVSCVAMEKIADWRVNGILVMGVGRFLGFDGFGKERQGLLSCLSADGGLMLYKMSS